MKLRSRTKKLYAACTLAMIAAVALVHQEAAGQATPCIETNGVKFQMPPQVDGGWDVLDRGQIVLGDDFRCTNTGPVSDIHIWGSWLTDNVGVITNFWIGIYDDVPVGPNNPYSHPGTNLLWFQLFGPGQFTAQPVATGSELFFDPSTTNIIGADQTVWYYCFYPTNPFVQQGTTANPTNYWLVVHAQQGGATGQERYGWKTSLARFNDAAVWGNFAGSLPVGNWKPMFNGNQPLDLSFKITTTTNTPPPQGCAETNGTKYVQWPNLQGGLDVWDNGPNGPWVLADDFICNTSGPITDIHIWGSYLQDQTDTNLSFWLAIYDDVQPTPGSGGFSHPGNLLWQEQFGPGQYIQTFWGLGDELFLDPGPPNIMGPDTKVWYYCFYPTNIFTQTGSPFAPKTYWLMARAQATAAATTFWGWKTTTNVQHDISVHANWPGAPPLGGWVPTYEFSGNQTPLDLSFKITTGTNPPPQGCVETNGVKYVQWPNMLGGLDVWNNGPAAAPWVLADDFVCTNPGPVSDIHLWGSWLNDSVGAPPTFWLSIYDDVPVSPTNNFSHPGKLQWQQDFGPADYIQTFWGFGQESFLDPGPPQVIGPDSQVWYYCFYPTNAFLQQGTLTNPRIYWLVASARSPAGETNLYGWKTTTNVQHDISVHTPWLGVPPDPSTPWQITRQATTGGNLDLAFKITTRTNCITPIACAADKSVECGSSWAFDPPFVGPNPCCTNPPTVTQLGVFTNVNNPCNALLSSVWKITDCVGTVAYCTQYVTIKDTTPPIITCATNKTVECGTSWVFDPPTATDNCCGTNLTVRIINTNATVVGPCLTLWRGVWQAADCCTNLSLTCTQLVSVVDTTPPVLTCPSNVTVTTCGTNVQVFWSLTATDVCNSVTITSSPPSGTFFLPNTTNTVTVQARDTCSNLTTCSFNVTVRRPVLGSLVINLANTNTLVVVHWTDGILTHSTNVLGPYIDVPGATPPTYTTSPTNAARFYRLRCNSP